MVNNITNDSNNNNHISNETRKSFIIMNEREEIKKRSETAKLIVSNLVVDTCNAHKL